VTQVDTAVAAAFERITPVSRSTSLALHAEDIDAMYEGKFGVKEKVGWHPRLCREMNYYSPDIYYEALVAKLVFPGCRWLDVGCGRDVFPNNPDLARFLSDRAGFLYGIDPDDNVKSNEFVDDYFHGSAEECTAEGDFDVATLRMVAEHIDNPEAAMMSIGRMLAPGGVVVIYTPYKWAPMSILAKLSPMAVHNFFKRILWATEERDTFPVRYRMNTRHALQDLLVRLGYVEVLFEYLEDCRTFAASPLLVRSEIALKNALNKFNLRYPEACLLAVYRKTV
jgi:2-polyprenyl-3-methyl-5-hydroxy-6-metoxy-1,4-benzoquinol methylase